jgi:hypothetical protein
MPASLCRFFVLRAILISKSAARAVKRQAPANCRTPRLPDRFFNYFILRLVWNRKRISFALALPHSSIFHDGWSFGKSCAPFFSGAASSFRVPHNTP